MSAHLPTRRHAIAGLAATSLLGACSTSPPTRLFTLSGHPGTTNGKIVRVIGVRPVAFPKFLDRVQLVRFRSPYEISASEFEHWAEGMQDMLTRVVVSNLADRLPNSHVLEASGVVTAPYDVTIEIAINNFEAEPGGGVVLYAQWIIRPEGGAPTIRSQTVRTDGPTDTPTQLADRMSNALSTLSDRIAASLAS